MRFQSENPVFKFQRRRMDRRNSQNLKGSDNIFLRNADYEILVPKFTEPADFGVDAVL